MLELALTFGMQPDRADDEIALVVGGRLDVGRHHRQRQLRRRHEEV